MNHLIDIWLFVCGGLGVVFAWWESRKGPRLRAMMLCGAWLIVVVSMVNVMLRVEHNESVLRDNQKLLKDNQKMIEAVLERLQ